MSGLEAATKSNVFKIVEERLDNSHVYQILKNFKKESDNHTNEIVQPKGGEVYLYYKNDGPKDYVSDGFKWRNHSAYTYKEDNFECMKITYYKCSDNPSGVEKDKSFRKRVAILLYSDLPVFVEYMGDENISKTSHGNSKSSNQPYYRSSNVL